MLFQREEKSSVFPTSYCRILLLIYISFNSVLCLEMILVLNRTGFSYCLHPKLLTLPFIILA